MVGRRTDEVVGEVQIGAAVAVVVEPCGGEAGPVRGAVVARTGVVFEFIGDIRERPVAVVVVEGVVVVGDLGNDLTGGLPVAGALHVVGDVHVEMAIAIEVAPRRVHSASVVIADARLHGDIGEVTGPVVCQQQIGAVADEEDDQRRRRCRSRRTRPRLHP